MDVAIYPYLVQFRNRIISFFFAAVLLYDATKNKKGILPVLLTGLLLSISFYLRFQMAFGIAGFGLWMLMFEKEYKKLFPFTAGFLVGILLNTYLDYRFYHELVFTPYNYFHVNITEGKAASFGTSSFTRYFVLLVCVITVPPLSILLLYYGFRGALRQYNNPVVISVIFFLIAHCFIGHKEDRFMFPVLNVMPIIVGMGLPDFIRYYQTCKAGIHKLIKCILVFCIFLNMIMLILLLLNPYSQTVEFSRLLKNKFKDKQVSICCIGRTPFEIRSGAPLMFYKNDLPGISLQKLSTNDSVRYTENDFIATTFNQIKNDQPLLDSLGYKPVLYSSGFLWRLNKFLFSKRISTINDIWVLYKR